MTLGAEAGRMEKIRCLSWAPDFFHYNGRKPQIDHSFP